MNNLIELLQQQNLIWQGADNLTVKSGVSTGFAELDGHLNGGFQQGVTEIQSVNGIGELRLLLPMFKKATDEHRLVVLIAPQGVVCAQALLAQDITLEQVLVVYPEKQKDSLWVAEQCLRSGICHSVVMWTSDSLAIHQVKRLQLACETGDSSLFILRVAKTETLSLPFDLSLSLTSHEQGLLARINKQKCGWSTAQFEINMAKYWPKLTLPSQLNNQPNNLVFFPGVKVG